MARLDDERRNNPFAAPGSDFGPNPIESAFDFTGHEGMITYGKFTDRLMAFVVDGLVMCIFLYLFSFVYQIIIEKYLYDYDYSSEGEYTVSISDLIFGVGFGLFFWLYSAGLESSPMQATPGKKLFGLKVTDLEGNRISFFQAHKRINGKVWYGLLLCIGYLVQPFTPRKQAWHDSLAGTLVVKG